MAVEVNLKDCTCAHVTVYQDRAEVCRFVKTKVQSGENEVLILKVSEQIDTDSVRVEGKGAVTILEVSVQRKHVNQTEQKENAGRVAELKEKLEAKMKEDMNLNHKIERIRKQRQVLDGFADKISNPNIPQPVGDKSLGGSMLTKETLENLSGFLTMFDEEAAKFDEQLEKTQKERQDLLDEITTINANIYEMSGGVVSTVFSQISILLDSKDNQEIELTFHYIVMNASWTPKYDFRVFGAENLLKVYYYGFIRQNTGEDWLDTKLTLSTAKPSVGGQQPSLGIQKVHFKPKPVQMRDSNMMRLTRRIDYSRDSTYSTYDLPPMAMQAAPMAMDAVHMETETRQCLLSTMYDIPREATIPSDNSEHKVTVGIVDFKPEFSYSCYPYLGTEVYLRAKVQNSSQFAFLPGTANVFLDNNYVCQTALKPVSPGEEFSCSLGTDATIKVTYNPVNTHHDVSGMWNKVHTKTFSQDIKVKNTKADPIKIHLADHVPLSTEEKIKVNLLEPKFHKDKTPENQNLFLDKYNNINWNLDIPAGKTVDLSVKYSVEFPSSEEVDFFVENVVQED